LMCRELDGWSVGELMCQELESWRVWESRGS
jgi:hypothetical protein